MGAENTFDHVVRSVGCYFEACGEGVGARLTSRRCILPLSGVQAAWRYSLMSPPQVGCRRIGWPGRLSSRLDCLSARFSFSVLLGFLTFCFFGDLSPMVSPPQCAGRRVRTGRSGCGAQRSYHPLMILDAEHLGVTAGVAGRYTPSTQTRTQRSTVRRIVEDHAARLSACSRSVT